MTPTTPPLLATDTKNDTQAREEIGQVVSRVCPDEKTYSRQFQQALAAQITEVATAGLLTEGSPLATVILDHNLLVRQTRVCHQAGS